METPKKLDAYIQERMVKLGMSKKDFKFIIGKLDPRIFGVLNGNAFMTPTHASIIGLALQVDPLELTEIQHNYYISGLNSPFWRTTSKGIVERLKEWQQDKEAQESPKTCITE